MKTRPPWKNPLSMLSNGIWHLSWQVSKLLLARFTLELLKCWSSVNLVSVFLGVIPHIHHEITQVKSRNAFRNLTVFQSSGIQVKRETHLMSESHCSWTYPTALTMLLPTLLGDHELSVIFFFLRERKMTLRLFGFHRLLHTCELLRDNILSTTFPY